jgi:hypothetical protein
MLLVLLLLFIFIITCNSSYVRKANIVMNNDISLVRSIRSLSSRLADETLLKDASTQLGVSPPWNAPSFVWKLAWKVHQCMIPFLHRFDNATPKDSFINLPVLWWKAIAGNRLGLLNDGRAAFDLLPSFTRSIVAFPFCYLYPKLHHQNVALRTVYLDNALNSELKDEEKANVIILGAGYDTRALRFLQKSQKHDFFELDFPSVMKSKALMIERFKLRRKLKDAKSVPTLLNADLNDLELVQKQLKTIFTNMDKKNKTIFVVEAVLMYMKDEQVAPLLELCIKETTTYGSKKVSFCFADRFPNVRFDNPEVEKGDAIRFFNNLGLNLKEWRPKPGRARHMGICDIKIE